LIVVHSPTHDRLEANCKALSDEIKALEGVADQLRARLATKERTKEIARQFANYCCAIDQAFETVSISRFFSKGMLTALRVIVLASLEQHVEVVNKSSGDSPRPKSKVNLDAELKTVWLSSKAI